MSEGAPRDGSFQWSKTTKCIPILDCFFWINRCEVTKAAC